MRLCIRIRRDERGEFTAYCPSLPGCVSTAQTAEGAKEALQDAIRGYLASVNNFVPEQIQAVLEYQA